MAIRLAADEPADDTSSAAEALLAAAEGAAGRPFDPAFRERTRGRLERLSGEELAARRHRVASSGLGEPGVPQGANLDLVYTPVTPCRVADTRVAGGSLAVGVPRDLRVAGVGLQGQGGDPSGCGVPTGEATAAMLNFVAVNPAGAGNLRAWAYSTPTVPPPNASILNYAQVIGLNIANGIAVPICDASATTCPFDLLVQADVNGSHLVVDVVGYFHGRDIGEYVSASWNTTAPPHDTWGDAASISLTAGEWDVSLFGYAGRGGNSTLFWVDHGISTTAGNSAAGLAEGDNRALQTIPSADVGGAAAGTAVIPAYRMNLSVTTTVYAKIRAGWGGGTAPSIQGRISARRVR